MNYYCRALDLRENVKNGTIKDANNAILSLMEEEPQTFLKICFYIFAFPYDCIHGMLLSELENRCDRINDSDEYGQTLLFLAIKQNNDIVMRRLVVLGANVRMLTKQHKSVLSYAIQYGTWNTIEYLLVKGAKVNDGECILRHAIEMGKYNLIPRLFKEKAYPHPETKFVYAVIRSNQPDLVRFILSKNINTSRQDEYYTALQEVVIRNLNKKIIDILLCYDFPMEKRSVCGRTALHLAIEQANFEMVKFLLERGADYNLTTFPDGLTCLYLAAKVNHLEMMDMLIKKGSDINALMGTSTIGSSSNPVQVNQTAIHRAYSEETEEVVRNLLCFDADIYTNPYPFFEICSPHHPHAEIVVEHIARLQYFKQSYNSKDIDIIKTRSKLFQFYKGCLHELQEMTSRPIPPYFTLCSFMGSENLTVLTHILQNRNLDPMKLTKEGSFPLLENTLKLRILVGIIKLMSIFLTIGRKSCD